MKIILLRHGRTESNENWRYCGHTDVSLSEGGIAELLEKKEKYCYPSIDNLKVYTSGLKRTAQTLKLLYGDAAYEELPDFKEMFFGEFEDKSYEELKEDPNFIKWCSGDNFANVCPGGESGYQMADRVFSAMRKLVAKNEDCIVFAHGGPIGAVYLSLLNKDAVEWYTVQPANGEGYEFEFENGCLKSAKKVPEY